MKEFFTRLSRQEIRNVLALVIVLGCFTLLGVMQVKAIPEGNKEVLNITIGFVFGGALAGVVGYYFGSSKNENDKTKNGD